MLSCGETVFQSIKDLASHMNTTHRDEPRECIFQNCAIKFNPKSVSRHHFRMKHFKINKTDLKAVHCVTEISSAEEQTLDDNNQEMFSEAEDIDSEDSAAGEGESVNEEEFDGVGVHESLEEEADLEFLFLMAYADFTNRLINYKFIPVSSVQEITSEFLKQSQRSMLERTVALRISLSKIPNLSKETIDEIVEETKRDPFLKAQEELSTDYKRTKFLEQNFHFVKPREVILNPEEVKYGAKKEVVHYVPIMEAIRKLIEDETFTKVVEIAANQDKEKGVLRDIKDGLIYQNSGYFKDNPQAMALMLYSDGVELTNPLGSGKGKHKIVQVFWSACEVPKYQRSSIDRLQLGMVFKERLMKKYGQAKIFNCLIEDLKVLESEGVYVTKPVEMRVKAGVVLYCADNLEAHIIGGYSACFSSKDICRWCHAQYKDLDDHLHNFDGDSEHDPWTVDEYENQEVEDQTTDDAAYEERGSENLFNEFNEPQETVNESEDTDDEPEHAVQNFGVKSKCVFNILNAFHCVTSMPPDSLHDLMEGVIPQDLLGIIRIFISKGWFTLTDYNKALKSTKFSRQESSNKPQEVPSSNKIKKLSGKATSHWVHCRVFLYILMIKGWIVDKEDPVISLAVKLSEVTDRLTAEAFETHEIDIVEDLIVEYLDLRKVVYIEHPELGRCKPKHHYISHYADAIRNFGPTSSYWTGRYESKHRVAKSCSEASKNFINISHTISHRQQMRLCSTYYNGMFSVKEYKFPDVLKLRSELSGSEADQNIGQFMTYAGDLVCTEIEFRCRIYKEGDLVVIRRTDLLEMELGLVKGFLLRKGEIHVIARSCMVNQNYLRVFESSFISNALMMIKIKNLQDHYPLLRRGTEVKFVVLQHHHVSFSYN